MSRKTVDLSLKMKKDHSMRRSPALSKCRVPCIPILLTRALLLMACERCTLQMSALRPGKSPSFRRREA